MKLSQSFQTYTFLSLSPFPGEADAAVMTPLCFHAMTLGNHEFDLGNDALESFITKLSTDTAGVCDQATAVVCANVLPPDGSMLATQLVPYMIQDFGDQQVAVVGLSTSTTTSTSSPDANTTFLEEVSVLEAVVEELQGMDINKIVLVTHTGYNVDTEALAAVEGVDIIIGGHTHTLLGTQEDFNVFGGNAGGSFPTLVNGVCVVTAWEYAHVSKATALTVEIESISTLQ